ncbi:putative PKHD-type hydroxylase, partial [Camellia lanceoleosa]
MKVIALLFGLENLKILYLYRFPCDDSEVTLNVCSSKQFSGGELFLRGVRCEDNVNAETQSEHRHGARPTKSGHTINLLLWCRRYIEAVLRQLKKIQADISIWGLLMASRVHRQAVLSAMDKAKLSIETTPEQL